MLIRTCGIAAQESAGRVALKPLATSPIGPTRTKANDGAKGSSLLLGGRVGSRMRSHALRTCRRSPLHRRRGQLFERLREFVAIDEIGERVPCRLVVTDVVRIASKRMRRRARRRRAATEALCLPRALALLAVSTISSAGSSRSSGWSCQRVNDERPSPSGFRKAD
jgi:hypothetical protein